MPGRANPQDQSSQLLKLVSASDAWQKNPMAIEILWPAKHEREWPFCMELQSLLQQDAIKFLDFILATQRDVHSDQAGLDRVEQMSRLLERGGHGRRHEQCELGS